MTLIMVTTDTEAPIQFQTEYELVAEISPLARGILKALPGRNFHVLITNTLRKPPKVEI